MKQTTSEKYNLAWFKLAECVARGEKERALGVYRLLSYSIEDKAYALQLEGDILSSFHDASAGQRYHAAMELYKTEGRLYEAAALSDVVLNYNSSDIELLGQLIELHKQVGATHKVTRITLLLVHHLLHSGQYDALKNHFDTVFVYNASAEDLYEMWAFCLRSLQQKTLPVLVGNMLIDYVLRHVVAYGDTHMLQHFLHELDMHNSDYYAYAMMFLDNR